MGAKKWAWMSSSRVVMLLVLWMVSSSTAQATMDEDLPRPNPWPHQFHSVLWVNYSGSLSLIDLWYDWPNGRNFNIIRDQLSPGDSTFYDLEWNNGTSFQYTLPPPPPAASSSSSSYSCRSFQLDVGILRPDWLVDGSIYLGQRHVDGFLCNVWQKADFIWYYEDVLTKAPVHWVFYTGRSIHVMTFEIGAVLEDSKWQAPVYCFDNEHRHNQTETRSAAISDMPGNRWMTQ